MHRREEQVREDEEYARHLAEDPEPEPVNILTIDTRIAEEDILAVDYAPESYEEREIYRYN